MPKNPPQDKKTIGEKRSASAYRRSRSAVPAPVKTLARIMKDQGWLQGVAQVRGEQQQWLAWFEQTLPEELRGSIVNVVRKGTELTVLAASAAWSARLRYALDALGAQLHERAPDIVKVRVRVTPSGRKGPTPSG
jgi:Dna[CI] antecedent DciA-like protein